MGLRRFAVALLYPSLPYRPLFWGGQLPILMLAIEIVWRLIGQAR
jgi:hypothetical protein